MAAGAACLKVSASSASPAKRTWPPNDASLDSSLTDRIGGAGGALKPRKRHVFASFWASKRPISRGFGLQTRPFPIGLGSKWQQCGQGMCQHGTPLVLVIRVAVKGPLEPFRVRFGAEKQVPHDEGLTCM